MKCIKKKSHCIIAAKQTFSDLGVEKVSTIKQLNEECAELLKQNKEADKVYREAKQKMTDLATTKYDIERALNLTQEAMQHRNRKKKNRHVDLWSVCQRLQSSRCSAFLFLGIFDSYLALYSDA
mgnify:CR=1 FL=1